jgi:hypothetical protein
MSMPILYVRVVKDENGKIQRQVMHNGEKIADISFVDALEIGLQFTSSLRYKDAS